MDLLLAYLIKHCLDMGNDMAQLMSDQITRFASPFSADGCRKKRLVKPFLQPEKGVHWLKDCVPMR